MSADCVIGTSTETLTATEATTFDDLERVIEKGLARFVEVGKALETIRDRRLYREGFSSFEHYLRERWGMSRAHAYRQIEAAVVAEVVSPIGDSPAPATESVARELAPLKAEPEQARKAWQETVQEHGPKPTASQVREVVKRKTNTDAKRRKAPARAARKPTKRHMEDVGQERAEAITKSLSTIKSSMTPSSVFGWALDALERDPDCSWQKFIEDIETAQRSLRKLIEKAEERDERSWPE